MAIKSMSEIFKIISDIKTTQEKQNALRAAHQQVPATIDLLRLAFDKNIKFALPEGEPPYKPCEKIDQHGRLHQEMRKMYIFLENGANIPKSKRETIFIQLLESIEPDDAKLLLSVKDKKFPYKGITRKLVEDTFPGLLSDAAKKEEKRNQNEQEQK